MHHYTKQGWKEMFYLTMHSTHFIYSYIASDMVKDYSNGEREDTLLLSLHGLLFLISSKGFLYAPSHRQDSAYQSLCYTSRGALSGMQNTSGKLTHCLSLVVVLVVCPFNSLPDHFCTFIENYEMLTKIKVVCPLLPPQKSRQIDSTNI